MRCEMEVAPRVAPGLPLGQKVFFGIRNDSALAVKTPICSVRSPESLNHRKFIERDGGLI